MDYKILDVQTREKRKQQVKIYQTSNSYESHRQANCNRIFDA